MQNEEFDETVGIPEDANPLGYNFVLSFLTEGDVDSYCSYLH